MDKRHRILRAIGAAITLFIALMVSGIIADEPIGTAQPDSIPPGTSIENWLRIEPSEWFATRDSMKTVAIEWGNGNIDSLIFSRDSSVVFLWAKQRGDSTKYLRWAK